MRMSRQTVMGALGSLVLHAGLLAVPEGTEPAPQPPPLLDDELVAIEVVSEGPIAPRPRVRAPEPEATPEPAPEPASEPSPAPDRPEPPTRPIARAQPIAPTPAPEPEPTMAEAPVTPEPAAEPGPAVDGSLVGDASGRATGSNGEGDGGAGASAGTGRSGAGASTGGDTVDTSSYGKEIVRLVLAELDEDPVPGLTRRDGIQVVLRVKPDGGLAWTGSGRFGFAQVVASSVGPVRTHAILKRIERASRRFPAHPAGLKRRHYVVDVTVKFSRTLARG
jgi:outer membrane biosynthesis protein TonB